MKYLNIKNIEESIFGKTSKFKLNTIQGKEIAKDLKNSRILILGAAGSIGKAFSLKLKNYSISKIIFLDKNENSLTELNREINLIFKKTIKREFVCQDLNNINIHEYLKSEQITHYFNFAALKHVRSEENFNSMQYLIDTNCLSPFKLGNLKKLNCLKKIFFISTDKVAYPSSFMGCSKKIMENELFKLKKKFNGKFISTVRFANVAFSNGSLLRSIYDNTLLNNPIGVPDNVFRYFVSHSEAADLCLISILKESNGCIIIPSYKSVGKPKKLKELAVAIIKKLKQKPIFVKKVKKIRKNFQQIILEKRQITGQKNNEFFYENNEDIIKFKGDRRVNKIPFYKNCESKVYLRLLKKVKSLQDYSRIFNRIYIIKKNQNKILLKNII